MTDIDRLTRAYREARQRYLSARSERQGPSYPGMKAPSVGVIADLKAKQERAAIELADALAGPA